jgi:hypothetical protein
MSGSQTYGGGCHCGAARFWVEIARFDGENRETIIHRLRNDPPDAG